MSERYLITGGFGFLGSHVIETLLARPGAYVHVVDNLSSNPIPFDTLLAEFGDAPRLSYDLCSVADYIQGDPEEYEGIIHLASPVGPAGVLKHSGRMLSSIVDDTYLLADFALESNARLLDVSTSEVYGGGKDGLCAEDDQKIVPPETTTRLEYAVAKLAAETALVNLHKRSGLDVVVVRPFNIAGPRQSGQGGFVLPRFLAQARLNLPLTVFGDGTAQRAFSHVKDMAAGVVAAYDRGAPGTAYNLGNAGNRITVGELADRVIALTGSQSRKELCNPQDVYGPDFREANDKFPAAGKATSELDWSPAYDVDSIIEQARAYMWASTPEVFRRLAGDQVIQQLLESRID